jgi:putative oxidoreductase
VPQDLKVNPSTRVDEVGRTGIYPVSGPLPAENARIVGQGELAHPEERGQPVVPRSGLTAVPALAVGRALFGGFFVYNGINHLVNRAMLTEYARSKQVAAPGAAVTGSGALILLGGLSLLTGTRPKVGASLIAAFLLGVTPRMHAFWTIEDPQERVNELVNFTKNLALLGGAALAAAIPEPRPASLPAGRGWMAVA